MNPEFGLKDPGVSVQVYGVSGREIDQVWSQDLWTVVSLQPQVVWLHVGGNDLSRFDENGRPDVVAGKLCEFADSLYHEFNVSKVLVSSFNERYEPYCWRRYPPDYNARVAAANWELEAAFRDLEFAIFWDHSRHLKFRWDEDALEGDSVHWTETTMKHFYKSFRGGLIQALPSFPAP